MNLKLGRIALYFITVCIVFVPFCVFGWLLWMDIVPGGVFTQTIIVDQNSPYIDAILPNERVSALKYTSDGDAYVSLLDEPTYFSLHAPNTDFDTVEVELLYKNIDQPIIELGALMDIYSNSYDLRPLQSTVVDELQWESVISDENILYMRNSDYSSVQDFYNNLPSRNKIAVFDSDFKPLYRDPNYKSLSSVQTFNVSLRGYHSFVTYVKDEEFFLSLEYMDMNRMAGQDDVSVRIWNEQGELWYEHLEKEDGNTTNNQISGSGNIVVRQDNWPEGVYRIELSGTSDIFWRQIQTSQRYVTFVGGLYIGDDVGYLPSGRSTTFYTNAKNFSLETLHSDATQRVQLGQQEVLIPQSHEKEIVSINDVDIIAGFTPIGDVKIVGDGKFSFSRSSFFNPDVTKLSATTDIEALGIDYILSGTRDVEWDGDWRIAGTEFAFGEIFDGDGNAKMTISTPYIQKNQASVDIHGIRLTFKKDPMNLGEIFRALRDLLPFGL